LVYVFQILVDGLAQGSMYALMAIAYAVIQGNLGFVTFGFGDTIMMGAFIGAYYVFAVFGGDIYMALISGFFGGWLLGILIELVCYRRWPNGPRQIWLICTIGFGTTMRSGAQIAFGMDQMFVPDSFTAVWTLGGVRFMAIQAFMIVLLVLLSGCIWFFLRKTRTGMQLKAVSMDKKAAALLGVDVRRVMITGNSLGCALGGVSGVLLGIYYNSVFATMGSGVGMKGFAAAVIGGLTSIPGAALGGILLGILENIGVAVTSTGWRDIVAFTLLIFVLLVRPSGLMGRKVGEKV
jgi:branched-chain amino acid transport system permease protein